MVKNTHVSFFFVLVSQFGQAMISYLLVKSNFMFSLIFKMDTLGKEIANIAIPAALALAADPIASLIDTAFIGHIGWFRSI